MSAGGLLFLAYAGGALSMWGVYFDTSWHRTLSRDSFFSLPHLCIYGGGAVVLAAAVASIVGATRGRLPDLGGTVLHAGPLRLPLGFTLGAVGVMIVGGIAAPMDAWWHATFGKDVLIWSPPHLVAVLGGATAATGVLFAAAAQRGRGVLAHRLPWKLAMVLPLVDLLHRVHWTLAHYTMTPATRTPAFYPFLVALGVPMVLVAAARVGGPWLPAMAAALFLAATVVVDLALYAIAFERYTITPVLLVPALAVTALYARAGAPASRRAAVGAGVAFALVFVAMETLWMAAGVGRPWPLGAVLAGLPRTLLAAAASGWIGWVAGGFLLAERGDVGIAEIFGSVRRARGLALVAGALLVTGMAMTWSPQRFGPPMRPDELALEPSQAFPVQEALFWEAVLDDDWGQGPRLEMYSEGIIDGIPLPIGPAWCAADEAALARDLPRLRFAMTVNGAAVELGRYPVVSRRLRDRRVCGWVGVVSRAQRASRNHIVYTVTPLDGSTPAIAPLRIEATVVFKDP